MSFIDLYDVHIFFGIKGTTTLLLVSPFLLIHYLIGKLNAFHDSSFKKFSAIVSLYLILIFIMFISVLLREKQYTLHLVIIF